MKNLIVCIMFAFAFVAPTFADVPSTDSVFGKISEPQGVEQLNTKGGGIGILLFVSNMIRLATVVAGVWVLFNFIFAGFTYITSSDSSAYDKIGEKLSMSVSGLLLIVASYTIIGIISLVIFGDPTFIINPTIPSALDAAPITP